MPPTPLSQRTRQKGNRERPKKRKAGSWYHLPLSQGVKDSNGREWERFPSSPPSRTPPTSALLAASESKLKANLGYWAKSFGLESQIEYLSVLTTGMCTVVSIRLSVGKVSFLKVSRVHPPSAGWWKFCFSFGKGCYAKQQRSVPKTAHKSEMKLHFQGHEIFTGWQEHTFHNGPLLDLALLREAISNLWGCACGATLWDQLHVEYQKR